VIHDSTMALMRRIVDDGELEHLVPERSWAEIARALEAPVPSRFVESLRECGALAVILPEVDRLFGVPQNERYHPEIDTGAHTMMALDLAAHEGHPPSVGFAVLLHDLGKGLTPESAWPSHRGHEERGLPLVAGVCERLRVPSAWRDLAHAVCREHLRLHRLESMRPGTILSLIESVDLLRRPDRLEPFIQACEADYRGRKGWSDRPYPQGERLSHALKAAGAVRAADLDLEGLDGLQIAERVRQARIAAIVESAAAHPPD
jgi:tRNA nucleotidyltransferase (CCA-adding enzyme)